MENKINKVEFKRCIENIDRSYMIDNYILPEYINESMLNERAKLTEQQKEVLNLFEKKDSAYINKGRCTGYTTVMLSKIASEVALSDGNDCFVIFTIGKYNMMSNIRNILNCVPNNLYTLSDDGLQSIVTEKNYVVAKNGCRVYIVSCPNEYNDMLNDNKDKNIIVFMDEYLFCDNGPLMLRLFETEKKEKNIKKLFIASTPRNEMDFSYNIAKEYLMDNKFYYMNPLNGIKCVIRSKYGKNSKCTPSTNDILADMKSNLNYDDAEQSLGIICKKEYLGMSPCCDSSEKDEMKEIKKAFDETNHINNFSAYKKSVDALGVYITYDDYRKYVKLSDNESCKEYTIEVYGEEYGEDKHEIQGIRNIIWENDEKKLKLITKPYHKLKEENFNGIRYKELK